MSSKKKTCFVVSPIGAANSDERKRADACLKHIFRASLEPLGYQVIRADEISETGSITHQVLTRVAESELVIADLTDHNPNVFYELAVRDTMSLPVIRVIKTGQRIPFDVADLRTIQIDLDVESAENAKMAIVAQAREIEAGNHGTTPVKIAGVLKHLESEKTEENIVLRQLIDGLQELKRDMRDIGQENSLRIERGMIMLLEAFREARDTSDAPPRVARARISEQSERELIVRSLARRGITDANLVRKAMVELAPFISYGSFPDDFAIEAAVENWHVQSNPRKMTNNTDES